MIIMSDLNSDIRLVVDTGEVSIGHKETTRAVSASKAGAVIVAKNGKKEIVEDLIHICSIAGTRVIEYQGNAVSLGALCGKPYSVTALAIINAGNSPILKEEYA